MKLVITIEADDPSDLDWIRQRAVGAVEDEVEENREHFDGNVEVGWELEDDE